MAIIAKAPTTDFSSTTLDGNIDDSTLTINVVNAGTIQTPTYAVIDRLDINSVLTPNAREVVYISSKSSNALTVTRGVNNSTARSHNSGAILEPVLSVGMWADLYTALDNEHTMGDGSHDITKIAMLSGATIQTLTNKILSGATITTFTLTNSAFASGASLVGFFPSGASGGILQSIGNSSPPVFVSNTASSDGWIASSDTWVFATASTFTIAGVDRTAIYTAGTRLKFTQTTVKYAVVVSSSFSTDTTVTIMVNTDHVIANAAISANSYSYSVNPQGYPDWFAKAAPTFTLTTVGLDNGSGGQPTTAETRIRVTGRQCEVHWKGNGLKAGTNPYIKFSKTGFPTVANSTAGSAYGVAWTYNQTDDANYAGVVGDEDANDFYITFSDAQTDNDTLLRVGFRISYEI